MFTINLEKAKQIKKNNLIIQREKILRELDFQQMEALTHNDLDSAKQISQRRKELQNLENIVDACSTVEELKQILL